MERKEWIYEKIAFMQTISFCLIFNAFSHIAVKMSESDWNVYLYFIFYLNKTPKGVKKFDYFRSKFSP